MKDWSFKTGVSFVHEGTPTSGAKPASAAEVAWTVLGTDNNSPCLESRAPLVAGRPEVRRYRGRYIVNDDPVGNYSTVASVTTVP